MKKLTVILGIVIFLISCSSDDPDVIKDLIIKKKEEISKIQKEINILETKYKELSNGDDKFLIPVKVKEIVPETFKSYIDVSGNIEALNDAAISPELGGQVKKIHVKEGQSVTKGQLLITLNTDASESQMEALQSQYDLLKEIYEKQKVLWDQQIGSEVDYLTAKNNHESTKAQLHALKAQVEMSLIRAPFNGIVDKIYVKDGELGAPGYPLIHVVNLTSLKIIADISETYLPYIKKGQDIEITIPTYPDLVIYTPIYRTSNVINPANRTFEVEVRLNNRKNMIKPNMVAILKINDITINKSIIVPSNIIKKDIQKTETGDFKEFLFTAEDRDSMIVAKKVYVVSGNVYNNDAVITDGLEFGQKVIVEGYNTVSNGTEINVLN